MQKSDFTLFFSLPLDNHDWQNLALSRVSRVMLPFQLAIPQTLQRLRQMNVRVVLRVEEGSYDATDAPARIVQGAQAARAIADLDAVIVGVEPEGGLNWGYGSPSWGQSRAYAHRWNFDKVRIALQQAGIRAISPGWTMRSISEDEAPQPGRIAWREIVSLPQTLPGGMQSSGYQDADGCGIHFYQYRFASVVDALRLKFFLKQAAEMWHKPLWIDEINIDNGDPLTRMTACIAMADLLVNTNFSSGLRVAMLCPFVSNGDGIGWNPGYLMRDSACYAALGSWIQT
jgi:hypothetical protein